MAASIKPYTEEHVEAVKAFNARLLTAGQSLLFPESPVPPWLPKVNGRSIYHEYFVAEDGGAVRGGYILKHQPFAVNGNTVSMAQYRLPLSEGQADRQFASVGVQMYLDAMRKEPRLYTVGIGGYQEAFAQMLVSAGWTTFLVPFFFRVLHASRFLRNIVYLRRTPLRRMAMNGMALSGMGALAIPPFQAWKTRNRPRDDSAFSYTQEGSFGGWTDDLWRASLGNYSLLAVRDASILNLLYPTDDPRWIRLKVVAEGRVVGWAVVLNVPMLGHNYFGNMRVGSLIDCLALAGEESKVARAAVDYLGSHGADIIVTNQSHLSWRNAVRSAGLMEGPSNYILAVSKKVTGLLQPFEAAKDRVHMTRGDGSGPENLLSARHQFEAS
jgi:hypothetical protein